MAVTIQDLLNDPKFKDNKSLLLLAKPDIGPHIPRKRKTSRLDRIEEKLDSIIGKIEKIESRLDKIESRLDKVEARLDKVEARLDKIESRLDNLENEVHSQFKAHGWTK